MPYDYRIQLVRNHVLSSLSINPIVLCPPHFCSSGHLKVFKFSSLNPSVPLSVLTGKLEKAYNNNANIRSIWRQKVSLNAWNCRPYLVA